MITANTTNRDEVIVETLNELKRKEYKLKFRRETTCLYCLELHLWILPDDFTVDASYHFEELSDPDADRILYAISSVEGIKGFLVDTCNVYADNISPEMMEKLK